MYNIWKFGEVYSSNAKKGNIVNRTVFQIMTKPE